MKAYRSQSECSTRTMSYHNFQSLFLGRARDSYPPNQPLFLFNSFNFFLGFLFITLKSSLSWKGYHERLLTPKSWAYHSKSQNVLSFCLWLISQTFPPFIERIYRLRDKLRLNYSRMHMPNEDHIPKDKTEDSSLIHHKSFSKHLSNCLVDSTAAFLSELRPT